MTSRTIVLAALVATVVAGSAIAGERVDVTPPLYREQARATASVRPVTDLATTPRPVPAAKAGPRIVAEAGTR